MLASPEKVISPQISPEDVLRVATCHCHVLFPITTEYVEHLKEIGNKISKDQLEKALCISGSGDWLIYLFPNKTIKELYLCDINIFQTLYTLMKIFLMEKGFRGKEFAENLEKLLKKNDKKLVREFKEFLLKKVEYVYLKDKTYEVEGIFSPEILVNLYEQYSIKLCIDSFSYSLEEMYSSCSSPKIEKIIVFAGDIRDFLKLFNFDLVYLSNLVDYYGPPIVKLALERPRIVVGTGGYTGIYTHQKAFWYVVRKDNIQGSDLPSDFKRIFNKPQE